MASKGLEIVVAKPEARAADVKFMAAAVRDGVFEAGEDGEEAAVLLESVESVEVL